MIRKICITLAMAAFLSIAHAKETITIVWGFGIGSNQANTVRILCEELNQIQDKYTFVIAHKPGAGGTIAANYVDANPENAMVSMSSSFIIRPLFETGQPTHNLDNFTPILVQSVGAPLYVVSKKFTSIEQVLNTPNITIGISGIGSISHLAANEIMKINKTATLVNFQSMMDAGTFTGGGHVDVSITFQIDVQGLLDNGTLNVIGATGSPKIDKNRLLTSYKLKDAGALTANYAIYASKKMNPSRYTEIHNLMIRANNRPNVVASYHKDQLTIVNLNPTQSLDWYTKERAYWKKQVNLIN